MGVENYKEWQSMQRPPIFEPNSFIYWKNRFETYVKSKDINLWHIIVDGDYKPVFRNPTTGRDESVPYKRQSDKHKKMLSKNNKTKIVLYNDLPKKEYERVFMHKTAKDIWNSLVITHKGNNQVKDNKIDLFVQQYEQFSITDDESIDCAFSRFDTIITSLKALDESFSIRNHVYEVVLEKDSEASKKKKERYKSLALKAKKESSDEETSSSGSQDEESTMLFENISHYLKEMLENQGPHNDRKGLWFTKCKALTNEVKLAKTIENADKKLFDVADPENPFKRDPASTNEGIWASDSAGVGLSTSQRPPYIVEDGIGTHNPWKTVLGVTYFVTF
ncbi:hypothetical protein Tco_0731829 [Tanacetum coccineum]